MAYQTTSSKYRRPSEIVAYRRDLYVENLFVRKDSPHKGLFDTRRFQKVFYIYYLLSGKPCMRSIIDANYICVFAASVNMLFDLKNHIGGKQHSRVRTGRVP